MNTIFVVATGDSLARESGNSFDAAAGRWNCGLRILVANGSVLHPACWKLLAFDEPDCDRALILDADTLVSAQCPNPFDSFPEDKLTVVTDRQTHQPHRDKAELDEWEIVAGERIKPANYFNTGMMVASRAHKPLFDEAFQLCDKFPSLAWHDQTPINVVMSKHTELLNYVEETWNFHNPNLRIPVWQVMSANIYHFPGNPDRAQLISEVQWK